MWEEECVRRKRQPLSSNHIQEPANVLLRVHETSTLSHVAQVFFGEAVVLLKVIGVLMEQDHQPVLESHGFLAGLSRWGDA